MSKSDYSANGYDVAMGTPRLYTYFRSGAAQRDRIGLSLKGDPYESAPVHLVRNGGEHLFPSFKALNPQARVPVLELSDGTLLAQSSAILEYLDETIPEPPFLPADAVERAKVRRVAAIIGCDIHPLNNVGPLNELRRSGLGDAEVSAWISKWITHGLEQNNRTRCGVLAMSRGSRTFIWPLNFFLLVASRFRSTIFDEYRALRFARIRIRRLSPPLPKINQTQSKRGGYAPSSLRKSCRRGNLPGTPL